MMLTYTPQGALKVRENAYRPGQSPILQRLKVFEGGRGYAVSANGRVFAGPTTVLTIRCITAGTITSLSDSAVAAEGNPLLSSVTMAAKQTIKILEPVNFGLWVVISGGTYRIVCGLSI